jgi:hypothetical protein
MGGDDAVEKQCAIFLQSAFKVVSRDEGVLNTCIDLIFTGMDISFPKSFV